MMRDGVEAQLLNHAVKRGLVGHTNDDTRRGDFKVLGVRQTTGKLKSSVVRLNDLLREGDVLPHEHIKVRVLVNLLHKSEPPKLNTTNRMKSPNTCKSSHGFPDLSSPNFGRLRRQKGARRGG